MYKHAHNGILFSHKKEGNLANMDGPWKQDPKRNKSDREGQMPYDLTYMWNVKNKTKDL